MIKLQKVTMAISILFFLTLRVEAAKYAYVTAEDGKTDYNFTKSQYRGWYTEPRCANQKFSVGYKQAERKSDNPKMVATIKRTDEEHYNGKSALEIQVIANNPKIRNSTAAYKVCFDVSPGNTIIIDKPKDWYLGFAMKIDAENYTLPQGAWQPLLFQQWWQGSPYPPPVSLQILNQRDSEKYGWKDANPDGNFALVLRDVEHDISSTQNKVRSQTHNLGPVKIGHWLEWVICVRPDPSGKDGSVTVWKNGEQKICLRKIVVGFNQDNQLGKTIGIKTLWVNFGIYRANGENNQRFYFDEITLSDKLSEATATLRNIYTTK